MGRVVVLGVASGVGGWAGSPPGQQVKLGPSLCPQGYTRLTHETIARECGDITVHTGTLSPEGEGLGHLTWACLASPAELLVPISQPAPNLLGCGQAVCWSVSPGSREVREGTLRF